MEAALTIGDWHDNLLLNEACATYQKWLGLAVKVDQCDRRITVTTNNGLAAIAIPDPLGTAVLHGLISSMQPAAVLATGSSGWLTFLTDPRHQSPGLSADLVAARVRRYPSGTPIELPVPGRVRSECGWISPPTDRAEVPPWSVVIALARRALYNSR